MAESQELPNCGLKCRKCRSGFLAEIEHDGIKSTSDLYVFSDENMPQWISQKVEEGGWTKGRLNCPNCQSRIGGFDFVSGADYPVHLIKSKVDYWKKSSNNSTEDNSSIVSLENTSPIPSISSSLSTSTSSSVNVSEDSAENMTESECFLSNFNSSNDSNFEISSQIYERPKRRRKYRRIHEKKKQMDYEKLMEQIMNAEPELDDLDASLICSVCLDLLFDPYVTVPCNHTFCETCLRRIGSKEPMNTQCPMCRQRIVYCEPQQELAISIRESYPDIYHRRQTSEKTTNVYQMQLPWRPGWRTLVTGHGLGGNTLTATSYLDRLRKIVQLLPYYIPPVVIANLINMAFFCVLLGAVEVLPFLTNIMMQHHSKRDYRLFESHMDRNYGTCKAVNNKGITPNTFLEIVLHQTVARPTSTASVMINDMPLPPTYIPPESTIQDLDATFFYVIGGMTILAMAFGNLIILNFPTLMTLFGHGQRYMTFWEFNGLLALVLIPGYIFASISPKSSQELWKWIAVFQSVGEFGEAFIIRIWNWITIPKLAILLTLTWVCVNIRYRLRI